MSDEHLRAAYYCAAAVIRSRQRSGEPIPEWLRRHYRRLDEHINMSRSGQFGHESDSSGGQLEDDTLITAREAAELLGKSKRQCQRIAADLGGHIVGGRWLFRRAAVIEYTKGPVPL